MYDPQGVLRVAASAGVQQVLDAVGMVAADLQELEQNGFQLATADSKPFFLRVSHHFLRLHLHGVRNEAMD